MKLKESDFINTIYLIILLLALTYLENFNTAVLVALTLAMASSSIYAMVGIYFFFYDKEKDKRLIWRLLAFTLCGLAVVYFCGLKIFFSTFVAGLLISVSTIVFKRYYKR